MMAVVGRVDFAIWGTPVPTKGYARRAVFRTALENIVVSMAAVGLAAPVRKGSNVMTSSDVWIPVHRIAPIAPVETMVARAVAANATWDMNARIWGSAIWPVFPIVLESNVGRMLVVDSAGSVYRAGCAMERGFASHRHRPRTEGPAM